MRVRIPLTWLTEWLSGAALLLSTAAADETQQPTPEVYQQDVAFLLDTLEERAEHLIGEKRIVWDDVRSWAATQTPNITTVSEHLQVCTRLVARLRDGHARLKDCSFRWPDESGDRHWQLARLNMLVDDNSAIVIGADPATQIPIGTIISTIDDMPAIDWIGKKADELADRRGYSTRRHAMAQAALIGLAGWVGIDYRITGQMPDGTAFSKTVSRTDETFVSTSLAFSRQLDALVPAGRNSFGKTKAGNGFLRLKSVPRDLPEQLDKMLTALGNVPGMIIDMRANSGGGCDHYEVFARFLERGEFWGKFEGKGDRPFGGPVVILIDAMTASSGETLSGLFKEEQRALLIGPTPTAGMSSRKISIPAPSGLFSVYFSVASNMQRFNGGRGIEGIGIVPHIIVPYNGRDLANGVDSQIKAAEELLMKRTWPEYIDYEPNP
ncbi:MAG: hypothetical protein KDN22_20315 [Verrucomicrobiae bacterium]|nr:hypothetical protein [Verrucomicrobiae bacterium]